MNIQLDFNAETNNIKNTLLGLRQYLAAGNPLKFFKTFILEDII